MSIALAGVRKRFDDVVAVDTVTLDVASGSLTALLGPSGCGKSTLLRLIAGFDALDAGTIAIAGRDVTDRPLRERNVGFVFQNYALFPHLTVAQNVAFGLEVRRDPAARIRSRVRELLDLVGLPGYGSRRPHELSGGQRQRVALARALAPEPATLLLDEPFTALDVNVRRELRAWLRELHARVPVTTVLVTHDADEAMEIADRLVLMRDGRIEQAGAPRDVYDHPVSPFALTFLGPANAIRIDGNERYVRPHDLRVETAAFSGSRRARVERLVALGARTRFHVVLDDGTAIFAEVAEPAARESGIAAGDAVFVAPRDERAFAAGIGNVR